MAGKIIADQIEHSTAGSLDTSYVVNGSAKAWANYSGAGTVFRDSFNCASAVDNGTGDYSANYTSSLANDDYSVSVGIRYDSGANAAYSGRSTELKTFATGSIRYVGQVGGGSALDYDHTCPQIMGDLA